MNKAKTSLLLLLTAPLSVVLQTPTLISFNPNATQAATYTVTSSYESGQGLLFYNRVAQSGAIVEVIEKFYTLPPVSNCSSTTYGNLLNSLAA